jgi:hypothetical protein
MNPPSAESFYRQRAAELRVDLDKVAGRQRSYRSKFVLDLSFACIILYQALVAKQWPLWILAIIVPLGIYFEIQSKRCERRTSKILRLIDYYDAGIARLSRAWDSLDEGSEFIDLNHFYASDLDLFGRGSLFQLLCSARTQAGRETLANWMKGLASKDEVLARHAGISELRERHDFREALASTGSLQVSNCRPETFRNWVASPQRMFPSWARSLAPFLVLATAVTPLLIWRGVIDVQALSLCLGGLFAVEIAFAVVFLKRVRSVSESIGLLSIELPIACEILRVVEREQFSSPKLIHLAERMKVGRSKMTALGRLISLYKERDNPYFSWLSYFLLWGTQFSMAIDEWRVRHGEQMLDCLAALGELEALTSLSAYAYEHPLDTFPNLLEGGPSIEAEGLGHPLLDESTCVRNDFQLGGNVQFLIVSGSNMSGKSTFLRAIGLNTVLAWMGAPVRCTKFMLLRLEVGAAIRVQDSVIDGRSHFLAEMQRLRRMIDTASEAPLLYLADEIMSGTNSKDRRIATEWVVRALVLRGAIGVITTHDLALTEIASDGLPGKNVYFEDTGESGNLVFDYKVRAGLLTHSNALNIAHMLGIDTAATGESAGEHDPSNKPPQLKSGP